MEEIAKEPTLEVNNPSDISASPGSWLTLTVKSDKLSQYVFDKDTDTVGENGVIHVSVSVKVWTSVSPNSEFIVDVNNTGPWLGFWKMLLNVTVCEFPFVVVLLSGGTTS